MKKYAVHCYEVIEYLVYVEADSCEQSIELVKDNLPGLECEVNSEFQDFYSEPMSESK